MGDTVVAASAAGRAFVNVVGDPLARHDVTSVAAPDAVAADGELLVLAVALAPVVVAGPLLQTRLFLLLQCGHGLVRVSSRGYGVRFILLGHAGLGGCGEEENGHGGGEAHIGRVSET